MADNEHLYTDMALADIATVQLAIDAWSRTAATGKRPLTLAEVIVGNLYAKGRLL